MPEVAEIENEIARLKADSKLPDNWQITDPDPTWFYSGAIKDSGRRYFSTFVEKNFDGIIKLIREKKGDQAPGFYYIYHPEGSSKLSFQLYVPEEIQKTTSENKSSNSDFSIADYIRASTESAIYKSENQTLRDNVQRLQSEITELKLKSKESNLFEAYATMQGQAAAEKAKMEGIIFGNNALNNQFQVGYDAATKAFSSEKKMLTDRIEELKLKVSELETEIEELNETDNSEPVQKTESEKKTEDKLVEMAINLGTKYLDGSLSQPNNQNQNQNSNQSQDVNKNTDNLLFSTIVSFLTEQIDMLKAATELKKVIDSTISYKAMFDIATPEQITDFVYSKLDEAKYFPATFTPEQTEAVKTALNELAKRVKA